MIPLMAAITTNHKLVPTCRLVTNTPQLIGIIIILSHGTREVSEEPPTRVRPTGSSTLIQLLYTAQEPLQNLPRKACAKLKNAPNKGLR